MYDEFIRSLIPDNGSRLIAFDQFEKHRESKDLKNRVLITSSIIEYYAKYNITIVCLSEYPMIIKK